MHRAVLPPAQVGAVVARPRRMRPVPVLTLNDVKIKVTLDQDIRVQHRVEALLTAHHALRGTAAFEYNWTQRMYAANLAAHALAMDDIAFHDDRFFTPAAAQIRAIVMAADLAAYMTAQDPHEEDTTSGCRVRSA